MSAFDRIAGYKKEKEELMALAEIFKNRRKYELKGATLPKGIIFYGPAGTGKTLVALAVGLQAVVEEGTYKRILYLRGNIKLDEDIGFLPGTEQEKLDWALSKKR